MQIRSNSIAKSELKRLDTVVQEFQEFAHAAPAAREVVDLCEIMVAAGRLALTDLASRGATLDLDTYRSAVLVEADSEQLTRALLNILRDSRA